MNSVESKKNRSHDKTEYIATLSRVEDMVDDMIGLNVLNDGLQTDDDKIKKCIELLSALLDDEDED